MPITEVQKSIRVADSLNIMKRELDSTTQLVNVMQFRIKGKDSTITDLQTANGAAIKSQQASNDKEVNMQKEIDARKEDTQYWQKLFVKQSGKTTFASILGLAGILVSIFIKR